MSEKTKKLLPIIVLLFIICTTAYTLAAYADSEYTLRDKNGFVYDIDLKHWCSATIIGCQQHTNHLVIPSTIETDFETLQVLSIDSGGSWPEDMTSLEIPSTIRYIDGNPWKECNKLETVSVDSGNPVFESIDGCLYNKIVRSLVCCPNRVESIEIKEGTLKIEEMALGIRQNLKYVRIPESLIMINGNPIDDRPCFPECEISQSELTFDISPLNTCFSVYDDALYDTREHSLIYCRPNKKTVQFPADLEIIPDYAFWRTALEYVELPNGLLYIGDGAFYNTSLQNIIIPDSVVYVGEGAFEDCYALYSVKLSSSMKTIEEKTFSGCPSLIYVRIPSSIVSIGWFAFENNSWKMVGIVDPGSYGEDYCRALKESEDDMDHFVYYDGTDIIQTGKLGDNCEWSLDIAGNLSIIGKGEIQFDPDLANSNGLPLAYSVIDVQEGITTIPDGMLSSGWEHLYKVRIPNTVTYIGKDAFSGCQYLETLTIPESVLEIGERAFADCYSLEKLVIPNSVLKIGNGAFAGCDKLELVLPNEKQFNREKLFSR